MKVLKASTSAGQGIIARASSNKGLTLREVYGSYSAAKAQAYEDCRAWYRETENSENFRICSANGWAFSCAWEGTLNEERILRYETSSNSYMVMLEQ